MRAPVLLPPVVEPPLDVAVLDPVPPVAVAARPVAPAEPPLALVAELPVGELPLLAGEPPVAPVPPSINPTVKEPLQAARPHRVARAAVRAARIGLVG